MVCVNRQCQQFQERVNFFRKLSTFLGRVSIILGKQIKNCLLILGKSQRISGQSQLFQEKTSFTSLTDSHKKISSENAHNINI